MPEPLLLEPDSPGVKRMIVVAADEIDGVDPRYRRFLLKAYAIDGQADKEAPGLANTLHPSAAGVANPAVSRTLADSRLSNIEKTRCLWKIFGTEADPGLCP